MRHMKDYQQPWTLPFGLMEEKGLLQAASITFEPTSSGGESNVNVRSWNVEGAANTDVKLWEDQDW